MASDGFAKAKPTQHPEGSNPRLVLAFGLIFSLILIRKGC